MQRVKKKPRGRPFPPGNLANPHGRPAIAPEVKALAREHAPWVIEHLRDLAENGSGPVSVAACKELLDRAIGKSVQAVEVTGRDGEPLCDAVSDAAMVAALVSEALRARKPTPR